MDRRPAAARVVAPQFCASDGDSRVAGFDPLPSQLGARVQSPRQPHSEGAGGCQHQAGLSGHGCTGCVRSSDAEGDDRGRGDAKKLAEMSRGLLRNKIPELQGALEGRMKSHHRFLLKELMEHLEFVESKIARLE